VSAPAQSTASFLFFSDTPMKTTQRQPVVRDDEHHTRLYFNIFMALLALGLMYMIAMLFLV
jgi:hypothetical protein